MKALVISGGGSLGAFTAGALSRWDKDYDIVCGVSTGALLAPLAALKKWDRLEEAYTSVSQKDIFSYSPIKSNGKPDKLRILWRFLIGAETLGETKALRKTINRFFTADDYLELRNSQKRVVAACQNMQAIPSEVRYFDVQTEGYEDFKDWIWASANAPLSTSLLVKLGVQWTDAGVTELFSLRHAIELGAREVDVIIHRTRAGKELKGPVLDAVHNATRLVEIIRSEAERNDIVEGLKAAIEYRANVTVYWMPKKLTENSLIFNKEEMRDWFMQGYECAFDESRIDRYNYC